MVVGAVVVLVVVGNVVDRLVVRVVVVGSDVVGRVVVVVGTVVA